jgi:hypothetical protein
MPCDTVRTIKTELTKSNLERLKLVMEKEGWNVTLDESDFYATNRDGYYLRFAKGDQAVRHNFYSQEIASETIMRLQRLYAERTVTDGAKRFGLRVFSRTENEKAKTIAIKVGR